MNPNSPTPDDRKDKYHLSGLPGIQHHDDEKLKYEVEKVRKEFERICAELGILQKQLACLLVLRKLGNEGTLEDIRSNLGKIGTPALVGLLNNMEKSGYIEILGDKQITGAKLTQKSLDLCRGKI